MWYFGMRLPIGVDSQSGLAHSAVVTPANRHDKHPLPDLLHGDEQRVYGDWAYASQKQLIAGKAPKAKDFTNQRVRCKGLIDQALRAKNRSKSRIRARRVESMSLVCSSGCGGLARCVTLACRRTRHERSRPWAQANIYLGVAKACWHRCVHEARNRVKPPNGATKRGTFDIDF